MIKVLPPKTAKEVVAREKERKARTTLLMALPEDHLAKFHKMADAKEMWEAIKSRFGGNDESKKMQKYLLKQQFEGFLCLPQRVCIKGTTTSSSSNTQNVAFVSSKNTSGTNDVSTAYSISSPSISKSQKEGSSSYTDEVIHSFFTNQSSAPQLDYYNLEQINDDYMEEMDLKWHFARDCTAKGNQDSRRRDVGYNGNKARDNGKRLAYQDNSKALVTIDKEDIDWPGHVEEDAQNYAMMAYSSSNSGANDKFGLGYSDYRYGSILSYENEVLQSVFTNKESDLEDTPINDRYAEGTHAVHPPMTGNYMPSGPDVEIDYSKFTYGPKQTSSDESDSKPSEYASCESESSVETPTSMPEPVENAPKVVCEPKVWTDAPIIEEYESDSDDDSMSNVQEDKEKHIFAFTDSNKHVKPSRENFKETCTPNHYLKVEKPDRNGHTRKGLGYAFTRKACFVCDSFSYLIRDCDFHEKRMAKQAALTKSNNKVTGQRENRPVWNNVQRVNHQNKHMTGNKAHLADYQEFRGGSVAFGGSNRRITGKEKIKAGMLDFEDVYYVEQLKHYNLFSVSHMCDKKNKVLFTDTDCLAMSPDFKLPNENQAEAINTACYVLNRVLVTKPQNKTPFELLTVENQANKSVGPKEANNSAGTQANDDQGAHSNKIDLHDEHFVLPIWSAYSTTVQSSGDKIAKNTDFKSFEKPDANTNNTNLLNAVSTPISTAGPSRALNDGEPSYPDDPSMLTLRIFMPVQKVIGTKWVYMNKKDERGVVVRNKARLVAQGHRQEEGIDYDDVFAPVARIEAIRIFLAFASYMGFIVYQMDVKSAFMYGTIDEEALYGLHQAPRAWYATLSTFLEKSRYKRGSIDKTLFIKQDKKDIMLVQVYVDDIIFGSTKKAWCDKFEKLIKNRFQMSSMGELTFFFGLQTACTPIKTQKPLVKDEEAVDVDVYLYMSMIGSLMYLTASRPNIMFAAKVSAAVVLIEAQHHNSYESSLLGVNTPRCDEDSLEFIELMTTVSIKKVNDVVKFQALVDRKKVVVTEDVIRHALHLDDADGVECLPNEEIFTELARRKFNFSMYIFDSMVKNVDSPTKFIMYPWFLQVIINAQVDDLSSHTDWYTSPALTQKVFDNMRRVGKGFSGVETPLFATMLVQPQPPAAEEEDEEEEVPNAPTPPSPTNASSPPPQKPITTPPQAQPAPSSSPPQVQPTTTSASSMTLLNTLIKTCATLSQKVAHLEHDKIAQELEIIKLKKRVKKLEKKNRSKSSRGRIKAIDADEDITLVDAETQVDLDAELQRRKDDDNAAIKEMAKRLHDEEVEQATAREKQEKEDLEKAKNMAGYKMEHFKGMTYEKVRPIFEREYNKVQTLFKPEKDEEPTKKRVAEETLLQESFKKLKAVEVLGQSTKEQKFGYIIQVIKLIELKKLDGLLGVKVVKKVAKSDLDSDLSLRLLFVKIMRFATKDHAFCQDPAFCYKRSCVLSRSCVLLQKILRFVKILHSQMHNNIMAAGSRDHPPMLAPGRYPQWRSRFLRYVDTRPNSEALRKCILSGPYKPTTVLVHDVEATDDSPAVPKHTIVETPTNMSPENKAHFLAEKEAIHLILTGIGNDIYSTVDACQTALEMWEAIEMLQQGSHISSAPSPKPSVLSRSQTTTRHKGKEIAKPITPPSETASEEDIDPEQAQRDKDIQKNLALIAKYFKKINKPTNNNLRTSSNSKNKNVDMTPRYKNNDHFGQFGTQRTVNIAGTREKVGSPIVQKSGIQCFNCKEYGHFAKECRKPKRVKDSAYHMEKMLMCKQAEQGVPLQAKQYDWLANTDEEVDEQELEAHYNYMAKIQEVPTADSGTDLEPVEQVQNDAGYNVFANHLQHSEQSESISNTCLVETDDSNVTPDSPDMCEDDIQNEQNDVDSDDKPRTHADLKYVKSLEKKIDEVASDKAEFLDMYDVILQECVSKDVMCSYLMSLSDLDALDELQCLYLHKTESVPKANVSEGLSKPVTAQTLPQTAKKALLCNFVEKFLGSPILGYGDLVQRNVMINRVYYVKGLNHNLFSVGQFCDADLKVAFRKSTCFVRDLQGNNLLTADADVTSQQELDRLFGSLYDEFFNAGCNPLTNNQSTSAPSNHTNVHAEENNNDQAEEKEQIQDDEFTNPFYHPLEQVRGNPSRPVQTRRQLATDPEMCMYALTVSTAESKNIKEAMADSAWIEAMEEELHQFDRLQVWELVDKPFGKLIIKLNWLWKNKKDEDQTVIRNKARLVAKGYAQEEGIDFEDSFALVARLEEKVYVAQPDGFVDPDHPEKVYRLRKARYGLKQAPRAWYDELSKFLISKGFTKVNWMSKKQNCTAMSSAEAEYVALSVSCAQVMWMRIQLQDYGFNYNKIPLYCDSQSAITISCNPVQHSRTKHIHTRYHFIKEQVENGIIELYFVRTEYQLADMFTKALPEDWFKYLVRRIGMRCLTPVELEVLEKEFA
nr:hypothetical protein [Tanacetum cinerariifolium]